MTGFKRKTRLISFRISEDEYERLRASSLTEGARSVSDYARTVLVRVMDPEPCAHGACECRVAELEGYISELRSQVKHLAERLEPAGRLASIETPALGRP